jgi:Amt family ammonium transporter
MDNSLLSVLNAQFAVLALLLPAGLILIAGGALKGRRPAKSAVAGLGALALAAISFWATGFAFHLGGVGLIFDLPGLEGLVWEWASPLNLEWGVMGLRGFFLLDEASTPAAMNLYLAYLPSLAVAVILPALSFRERMPGWMATLCSLLIAALVYPIAANWFSGGGWLMYIGDTLGLGHGFVDLTGASTAAVIGGLAALLGMLFFGRRLPPLPEGELPTLPPVHLPVLAVLGAILTIVGTMALVVANPLHTQAGTITPRAGVNLALAAAGGAFVPWLYTWFATGTAHSLVAARGAAAGVLSVAAAVAFIPPWAALALGAAVGLLVLLLTFLVQYVLRIEDPTGAIPVGLLGGVVGVLAVGLFGDGLAGQGWNGVGLESYLAVAGQGVTGFFPAPGLAPDWPGQINAQLVGLAAVTALTVALVGTLFLVLKVLLILWHAVPAPTEGDRLPTSESSRPEPEHPSAQELQDGSLSKTPTEED